MLAIFKRELKLYFLTPQAYIFMSTFLFITGMIYTSLVVFSKSSMYAEYLEDVIFIFIIEVPLLTMKVFSEERKNKTDQLLLTAPVSAMEIVMGKFLATVSVFLITVVITFLYPLLISFHGELETVQIIGSYTGFILVGIVLISIGIFISALTENMASSAILSFCAILFLWIIDLLIPILPSSPLSSALFLFLIVLFIFYRIYKSSGKIIIPLVSLILVTTIIFIIYLLKNTMLISLIPSLFKILSVNTRFSYFSMGIIRLSDVVFYISIIFLVLYITGQQIEKRRWSKGE